MRNQSSHPYAALLEKLETRLGNIEAKSQDNIIYRKLDTLEHKIESICDDSFDLSKSKYAVSSVSLHKPMASSGSHGVGDESKLRC